MIGSNTDQVDFFIILIPITSTVGELSLTSKAKTDVRAVITRVSSDLEVHGRRTAACKLIS
jgi:hypothetical protein